MPNVADDFENPAGVPIDGIIFGGRTSDREPLIRAISDLAEGVYDGLTLGAEATFAAEGKEGQLRYDPMSMRPFMSYAEGEYAAHWLRIVGAATEQPIFAHVNWFQKDPEDGHFLWPGYRDNLRPLLWLMQLKDGEVSGRPTPVGIIPTKEELALTAAPSTPATWRPCSTSTSRAGARRWASARSTSASSTASPRRSGRPTAGSRPRWTTPTEVTGA